jgi:gluconate 2-dehydrogenase gamma chain
MKRRTVLKIIALGTLSAHLDAWGAISATSSDKRAAWAWAAGDYKLQFFTPEENDLLDRVMDLIIPADSHSGGAHAANVSLFADRIVSTGSDVANVDLFVNQSVSSDSQKSEWRKGLQLFQEEAAKSSIPEVLARASAGEAKPQTDLERFFVTLKQMTLAGYYSSEIGIHQDLEYQGNTFIYEFPECTHH